MGNMIKAIEHAFWLGTEQCSYLIHINKAGKPVCAYFGAKVPLSEDISAFLEKDGPSNGRRVIYDKEKDPNCSLDDIAAEFSLPHKGDQHNPSLLLENSDSFVFDFVYESYEIKEAGPVEGLPSPRGGEELILILRDQRMEAELDLHYLVYEEGVIGRYVEIKSSKKVLCRKAMSYQLVLPNENFILESSYGNWAGEFQKDEAKLTHMGYFFGSDTFASGDNHNPLFFLKSGDSSAEHGSVYGFNLIYSGSHREEVEVNSFSRVRVSAGLSPQHFAWEIDKEKPFVTPVAILAYSDKGMNGVTAIFHSFIRGRVIPEAHRQDLRPVLYNNWEGTYMKFNEGKILSLARKAKKLGIELFVLDDGWFGHRDADNSSLGDYSVYKKKLPGGISGLSKKIHKMGMLFGLWFEPEAVSVDSDLYRAHPDWAISDGIHPNSEGRNQLLLDLTKPEVRDYLFEHLHRIISEAKLDFIKWDQNRPLSDIPGGEGGFVHRYILGLYELLGRVREAHPDLWMENCASGGGRNDLGMFSYFDTGWVSDDTDSFERASIQANMIKGYPACVMSNHVAAKTSHQLLRKTSLGTKFDVASIGVLGYELNLNDLDPIDKKELAAQIETYKKYRAAAQFGEVHVLAEKEDGRIIVSSIKDGQALASYCNVLQTPHPAMEKLPLAGFEAGKTYEFAVRPEKYDPRRFGSLINMILPFHVKEEGKLVNVVSRRYAMDAEKFSGTMDGEALNAGALTLGPQWAGTGLGENVRVLGDFGARLYLFDAK